ncbi:MAG TPA: hypothetical protein VKF84_13760 [Candidatus Sulfotelmatobacter sp.]|nr:hypothetical protein [Candidatus Sulfotelmatobacter sp.]
MISPINNVPAALPVAQATPVQPTSSKPAPQPSAPDTVQVSNAAKTLLQETLESSSQTATEASKGDVQAQRLLAREAAAKASAK